MKKSPNFEVILE